MRRRKRGKSSRLGMPEAPQVIFKETPASKLGDAGEASPLSSTSIGMFRIRFVHALCASLGAYFAIRFLFFFYAP